MLDDPFSRALAASVGVALVAGPAGCLLLWRSAAASATTLAHAGLLGVALGLAAGLPTGGLFAASVAMALILAGLDRLAPRSGAVAPAILAPAVLALGVVAAALLPAPRVDLSAILLGGAPAAGATDLALTWAVGALAIAVLALVWRPLVAAATDADLARAEGLPVARAELVLAVLVAVAVALAVRLVGVLFAAALLTLPAAAARRFASTPERMAAMAAITAIAAGAAGLTAADRLAIPAGPPVVAAALVLYLVALVPRRARA